MKVKCSQVWCPMLRIFALQLSHLYTAVFFLFVLSESWPFYYSLLYHWLYYQLINLKSLGLLQVNILTQRGYADKIPAFGISSIFYVNIKSLHFYVFERQIYIVVQCLYLYALPSQWLAYEIWLLLEYPMSQIHNEMYCPYLSLLKDSNNFPLSETKSLLAIAWNNLDAILMFLTFILFQLSFFSELLASKPVVPHHSHTELVGKYSLKLLVEIQGQWTLILYPPISRPWRWSGPTLAYFVLMVSAKASYDQWLCYIRVFQISSRLYYCFYKFR